MEEFQRYRAARNKERSTDRRTDRQTYIFISRRGDGWTTVCPAQGQRREGKKYRHFTHPYLLKLPALKPTSGGLEKTQDKCFGGKEKEATTFLDLDMDVFYICVRARARGERLEKEKPATQSAADRSSASRSMLYRYYEVCVYYGSIRFAPPAPFDREELFAGFLCRANRASASGGDSNRNQSDYL